MKFTKNSLALAILFGIPTISTVTSTVAVAQSITTVSTETELENALANSITGQEITLNGNITLKPRILNGKEAPWEIGNVTIDGNGHDLTIRGAGLSIKNTTTLKNMNLSLLADASYLTQHGTQYIYLNGNSLTLHDVKTVIGRDNTRLATVVMGNGTDTSGDANNAILNLTGFTTLKEIIGGNTNNTEKSTPSTININEDSHVNTVTFGKENNKVTGVITVNSQSNHVNTFQGGTSTNSHLTLTKANEANITNIHNVTIAQGANISTGNINNIENLILKNGAKINSTQAKDKITINNIAALGNNALSFSSDNQVSLQNGITGNLDITVAVKPNNPLEENIEYVTVGNKQYENITVSTQGVGIKLTFKDQSFQYIAPVRLVSKPSVSFINDLNQDGKLTNDEYQNGKLIAKISFDNFTQDELIEEDEIELIIKINGKEVHKITKALTWDDIDNGFINIDEIITSTETIEVEAKVKDPFTNKESPVSLTSITIDNTKAEEERKRQEAEQAAAKAEEERRRQEAEQAAAKAEEERKRQEAEQAAAKAEEERKRQEAEQAAKAEEERKRQEAEQAAAKAEEERKRQEAEQAAAKAEEERKRQEAEQAAAKAEEERKRQEAEQAAKAEEERKRQEAEQAAAKAEEERKRQEAEQAAAKAEEERKRQEAEQAAAKAEEERKRQEAEQVAKAEEERKRQEAEQAAAKAEEERKRQEAEQAAAKAEEERKRQEAEQAAKAEEERKRQEAEQTAKAEEERKRQEAEQAAKAEEERKHQEAEASKAEEERKSQEAEQTAKAEEERKRQEAEQAAKAEEERKSQEAEQTAKAEEERKRQEAEQAAKAEEERKHQEAEASKAEEERKHQEAEQSIVNKAEEDPLYKAQELLNRLEAKRIANIATSNLSAQAHSVITVGADITQAIIEKFPENGNNYRVWSKNTVANSKHYANFHKGYESDSLRTQLGISSLINERTQVGLILNDIRNDNDLADQVTSKNKFLMSSVFIKYQTQTGNFAVIDVGFGRIKNEVKAAEEEVSFRRNVWHTGLTFGKEFEWKQVEITPKVGIRYSRLGSANYQLESSHVQEKAVGFVSYLAGVDAGYRFNLSEHYSLKPFVSAEHWWNEGNGDVKVNGYNFNFNASNQYHYLAGLEFSYKNFTLKASAGITNGSQMAKQNLARLHLSYDF
ncbi:autotransporter outer membrane beta-barrel domain-containing protein [Actinobacillus genomosp. 1]|uniref:autotransporter outer membrane beta-barrel domain-containing protein n=1 Tax=Actinobacillus genomosp. 1 TaxID=254839 RepID=UPI00244364D4|nr:autotransporter outer membrane beta-barrel domain-containing protein [Actinobacillus genomosp. 1]WGE91321.1 autotransporter domain-containing protein [Actinobacillus genomosp. 1]